MMRYAGCAMLTRPPLADIHTRSVLGYWCDVCGCTLPLNHRSCIHRERVQGGKRLFVVYVMVCEDRGNTAPPLDMCLNCVERIATAAGILVNGSYQSAVPAPFEGFEALPTQTIQTRRGRGRPRKMVSLSEMAAQCEPESDFQI